MLAELHCHTKYSNGSKIEVEGINSSDQMIKAAVQKGIDVMAITDHDTMKGYSGGKRYAKKHNILLIPGVEISSEKGHILALGIEDMIKPDLSVDETLDLIHEQGGIGIASHPFDVRREGVGKECVKCDVIETFNALNLERLSNWRAKRFAENHKMPAMAGSDAHITTMIGCGLNRINGEKNIDSIIKAIRKGRNTTVESYPSMSTVSKWSTLRLQNSYESTQKYINKNYSWPKKQISLNMLKLVKRSPGKIDYALQGLAYIGVASAFFYSVFQQLVDF
ncbi:MAG: PHP domain-containing protein [Candidatus Aenigmatarchaeota archaeon]